MTPDRAGELRHIERKDQCAYHLNLKPHGLASKPAATLPIELAGFVLTPAEESEIDTRCWLLADKLAAEAAAHEREADELKALRVSRHVERVEENVTYLRGAK